MSRALAVLALVLTATACGGKPRPAGVRTSSDVLTRQEIAAAPVDNAYDAVMRLRPMFLRARSTATTANAYAVVYVDGIRRGPPETLQAIRANAVLEIRYISALDATTRYGMNVEGGVIQVTLVGR